MKFYPRELFTTASNESISYFVTSEDKPKLVLIHGNYSGANHWIDVIEQLEDKHSICAMDLRGFGESSYHQPIRSLKELAADVKELLEFLNWDSFNVIGWSLGGGVAMELAAMMPNEVEKLILNASVSVVGYPMFEFDMTTFQPLLDKPLTTYEQIENNPIYVLPMQMMKEANNRDGLAQTLHAMSAKNRVSDEFMDVIVDTLLQQRNLVDADYALMVFNITDFDTAAAKGSNSIRDIKAPVLLIHGQNDAVVLPPMAQISKEQFGDQAELVFFEEAGHAVHSDQMELWVKTVNEFLVASHD